MKKRQGGQQFGIDIWNFRGYKGNSGLDIRCKEELRFHSVKIRQHGHDRSRLRWRKVQCEPNGKPQT